MGLIGDIVARNEEFTAWRHALHENPGIGFEESFAKELVARKLREFGFDEVHTGIGKTGIVGVLRGKRESNRAIGLRADMDALPITEETGKPWASKIPGVMHACGHDGHTTSLLATAWYLAQHRDFAGTVYFIFQPAEEGLGGALAMIEDGLLERFPCDRLYSYHNYPDQALGHILTRAGRTMCGSQFFSIAISGRGGHAALPQTTIDPTQVAANIVLTAQSIVARNVNPLDTGIVSFTDVYAGTNSFNVIPDKATMKGCLRYFEKSVGKLMQDRLEAVVKSVAQTYGAKATIEFREVFVPLVNDEEATRLAHEVALQTVGEEMVHGDVAPLTGSEDFAFMIEKVPGSYVYIGGGPGAAHHNPAYDFNDAIIPTAASYFCGVVAAELGNG